MNDSPKVSVIIPVYNVEKYLRECLDSVVGQILKDIEIICVDDGSTDGSPGILREYAQADPRIIVITRENRGQSAARNSGLDAAGGEYVTFLDSDDFYVENTLAELFALAGSEKVDMIEFNAFPLFENKELEMRFRDWKTYYVRKHTIDRPVSGLAAMNILTRNSEYRPSVCFRIYRRGFLEENHLRFYEGIIHEDELFTFQCFLLAKHYIKISQQYYGRRVRENSTMTQTESRKNLRGYFLGMVQMLRSLSGVEMAKEEEESVKERMALMWDSVRRLHKELSRDEIMGLLDCGRPDERVLFDIYLKAFPPDHKSLFHSIGLVITYIPRKIGGGIRCCREHGIGYTLRRAKKKITGVFGA